MKAKLLIAFSLISAVPALTPSLLQTERTAPAVSERGVAHADIRPPAPARPANPLWDIPLASLQQTRLRPLFSPTRRPPAPLVYAPPPPPPPPVARRESPDFLLVGTIIGGLQAVALVKDPATQKVISLRAGAEFHGWRFTSIKERAVTVEKDRFRAKLQLPKQQAQDFTPAAFPVAAATRRRFNRRR